MKIDSEIQRTKEWFPEGKISEGDKEVQACSYKTKARGYNIQQKEYGQ